MKRVMVDMSATLIHHGHIRLLKKAKEYGYVIVGLTKDEDILNCKGYIPELSFQERSEILKSIKYVDEVVETNWLITEKTLEKYKINTLIHGSDNLFKSDKFEVIDFPRTEGISSSKIRLRAFQSLISKRNKEKLMLTPGPSSICESSIKNIEPVFGRGDKNFQFINNSVTEWLKNLSGQDEIISLIGSATLAIEIAILNFLKGKILILNTGFYSRRIYKIISKYHNAELIDLSQISNINKNYDWIAACFTETSKGYKFNINLLKELKSKTKANLFLDATGSIGLEDGHELADLVAFSSCKGLMGLTGGAFIGKKNYIKKNKSNELPFYLDYKTHFERLVTGPYHIVHGLFHIKDIHNSLRNNIKEFQIEFLNRYRDYLVWDVENQPKLCTLIKANLEINSFKNVVLYKSREMQEFHNIICHLHAIEKKNIRQFEKFIKITE
tara:strand:- start:224 stop:1549 length:1326 start_codon:yes stop_codon:yes gene_type:complete